jgi:hypothetical protein
MTQLETLLARVDSLKALWDTARPIPAPLLETLQNRTTGLTRQPVPLLNRRRT